MYFLICLLAFPGAVAGHGGNMTALQRNATDLTPQMARPPWPFAPRTPQVGGTWQPHPFSSLSRFWTGGDDKAIHIQAVPKRLRGLRGLRALGAKQSFTFDLVGDERQGLVLLAYCMVTVVCWIMSLRQRPQSQAEAVEEEPPPIPHTVWLIFSKFNEQS
eukprot:s3050_g2.t1